MSKVIELTDATFKKEIYDWQKETEWKYIGDKPAIIDFSASWCGPCKQLVPIFEKLAEDYDGKIDMYKVDIDTEKELSGMFSIRSVPSLLFIPMTGQPEMLTGGLSGTQFDTIINDIFKIKNEK